METTRVFYRIRCYWTHAGEALDDVIWEGVDDKDQAYQSLDYYLARRPNNRYVLEEVTETVREIT